MRPDLQLELLPSLIKVPSPDRLQGARMRALDVVCMLHPPVSFGVVAQHQHGQAAVGRVLDLSLGRLRPQIALVSLKHLGGFDVAPLVIEPPPASDVTPA